MKRIKSAVILQTLVFSQKEEAGLYPEQALQLNQADLENYKLHPDPRQGGRGRACHHCRRIPALFLRGGDLLRRTAASYLHLR